MDRVAVFVDAGYLFAQGSALLAGRKLPRHGEQKGVDSLIVTDMIALARNRAVSDAVLLSGDEDLRVGVQQAQEFGVRVHLVGIKPSRGSQSLFLLQESDTTHEWDVDSIAGFMSCKPLVVPPGPALKGIHVPPLEAVASRIASAIGTIELEALLNAFEGTKQLPRDIDRELLIGGRTELNRDLEPAEKKRVRELFVRVCRERLKPA